MTRTQAIWTLIDCRRILIDGLVSVQAEEITEAFDMAIDALSAEAVQGEWIEAEVFPEVYDIEGVKTWGSEMQCDQCGFRHTAIEGHMAQYNFCPKCGARMKGADDEREDIQSTDE